MGRRREPEISDAILDELLSGQDAGEVFESGGLVDSLKKALAERILNAEMDVHLDDEQERTSGNHRNGYGRKKVRSEDSEVELRVPRDRQGRYEPQLIEKYKRRFPGFDEKIIALYARGMTTREIQSHIRELYGLDISPTLVSAVTDAVHAEVSQWQSRGLESVYAIVYFDAMRVKIRDEGLVRNKAVYLAIGVRCTGYKEILGMWVEQTEGAKFWLSVMQELKNRGLEDILIAVVDGLKGFPEAIEAVFPLTQVQTCIVHLLRHSLQYASWKQRKTLAGALKLIYQAETEQAALHALETFEAGEFGQKFPAIAKSWRRNWEQVRPFFAFSAPIRKAIYTTNAIESLNSTVRRAVRIRGHFPNDRAAAKLLFLALRSVESKWQRPPPFWAQARAEFALRFEDRFALISE